MEKETRDCPLKSNTTDKALDTANKASQPIKWTRFCCDSKEIWFNQFFSFFAS